MTNGARDSGGHATARELRAACARGDLAAARALLATGAPVDAGDAKGKTALYAAAKRGDVVTIALLLDHGADLHAVTKSGASALFVAAAHGHTAAAQLLLERGHPTDVTDEEGQTVLFGAIQHGGVDTMRLLIDHGVDLHAVANDGRTALHEAASYGHVDAVKFLVERGAAIDAVEEDGWSALHFAASVDTARVLVELGIDKHATTYDGMTALHAAAQNGHMELVQFLLDQGLSVDVLTETGASVLNYAATGGNVAVMKRLIECGADIHGREKDGRTVLHSAARAASADVVAFLLDEGLAIDAVDYDRDSVFDYAVLSGDVKTMRLLMEHGADPHAGDENGRTALRYAVSENVIEAMLFLLEHGIDASGSDQDGVSAFHYAAMEGTVEGMKILIDHGADAFKITKRKETALHYAAYGCNAEALEMLLQLGLPIDSAEHDGSTALHNSAIRGNVGAVQLLIDNGADVQARTKDGRSVLHVCAEHGSVEAARVLFDYGARVNETDEDGETPLQTAARNGHVGMMRLLIEHGAEPHVQTEAHESIVHLATQGGHVEALRYALALGVDADARIEVDDEWKSPLLMTLDLEDHSAACEIAFELCSAGVDFTEEDREIARKAGVSTDESTEEDSDEIALWRSGFYASVDHWMHERKSGSTGLTKIPVEVVSRGEASVRTYLADVARSTNADRLHRCKICVVGPSEWGKTSLVQSLKAQKTFLTLLKDRTLGIDLTTCELTSVVNSATTRLEITFWDFAGQDVYHAAHTLFFSQRTLFVLVVDLEAYWKELESTEGKSSRVSEARMNRFVGAKIFRWVRSIFAHRPDAQFVVVGSKIDRLEDADVVAEIWDDLRDRLDRWKAGFAKGFDRELLPARASAKDIRGLQTKLARLGSSEWLVANIMDIKSISKFRRNVQKTITSSELGFPMWKTYTKVLQAVVKRREDARNVTSTRERIEKSIIRFSNLRRQLLRENQELEREACEQILRTLGDLGDVLWYEHEGAGVFKDCVILDPMLVIEVVREVIRHDFSSDVDGKLPRDGRITHAQLSTFPLWKDMDVELMHAFKALLQHFQLAYPADADMMLPESDIIVPAYWNADESTASAASKPKPKLSAPQKSLCDAFTLHRYCWEYEVPSELSETVFVQFAVQSHSSYLPRTVRGFCVEAGCAEFATSISLIQRDAPRDVLRIEVSGVSAELSWHNMRFYLMKMEKVLDDYTGDVVWRSIVDRAEGATSTLEARHPVGPLVKAIEDAITMGKGAEAAREKMPWMPPDMDWFIHKAWNDIASLQQLRMNHLIEEKVRVLEKLAIVEDAPRQFPALWSLEYDPEAQRALLRMSSDLSGRCYHVPLAIDTGSALLARHASVFKAGVSLFATVVGNAISLPIVQSALDAAKSAASNTADHRERVHNLIDKLDLSTDRFDTRTASKLSPGASMVLLRDLLKAYDDSLDVLEVSEISNLECAVTSKGEYVWAHAHEIAAMEGKITRCAAPPTTAWKELELPTSAPPANGKAESLTSSSSTVTTSPVSTGNDKGSSKEKPFTFSVSVDAVTGLSDWDWHKTYCKWQLYYGKSLTPLASDVTPTNGDSSCAPSWRSMRATIESVASVEMLRKCRVAVQVKRRSRIGWTKLIGEGEAWVRDFLDEDAAQNFSCEPVVVPLGEAAASRAVVLQLALED